MSLSIDELRAHMQSHIGQLNKLNQSVNEVVVAIKAIQQLINSLGNSLETGAEETPVDPE